MANRPGSNVMKNTLISALQDIIVANSQRESVEIARKALGIDAPKAPSGAVYIPLPKGEYALVDKQDYALLKDCHCRQAGLKGYVSCGIPDETGKKQQTYIHRYIMQCPSDKLVDHINGDVLDNRRSNLRIATAQQNQWNKGKQSNNTTGYKCIYKSAKGFDVRLVVNGQTHEVGWFPNIRDAVSAYNEAAARLHGKHAKLQDLPLAVRRRKGNVS